MSPADWRLQSRWYGCLAVTPKYRPGNVPYFWAEAGLPLPKDAGGGGGGGGGPASRLRWGGGYFRDGSFERMLRPTPTTVGTAPGRSDLISGGGGGTPDAAGCNTARTTPVSLFGVKMSAAHAKTLILPFRLVRSFFCLGATAAAWATAAGELTCWHFLTWA